MTLCTKVLGAALALLAVAGLATAQDGGVKLRYKLKKGEAYPYRTEMKFKQTQTIKDIKPIQIEMTQKQLTAIALDSVDDKGNLNVKVTTKELTVAADFGIAGGKYNFDSNKKDNDKGGALGGKLTPLYERLKGANLTAVINPEGKILELKGYKELVADILKDNPIAEQFAGGGSEDSAKVNVGEFFPQFKDKAVAPGDKWDVPFELKLSKVGTVKGKRTYWYQEDGMVGKRKVAKITVSSDLTVDLNVDANGAKVTGKLSISNSKGDLDFYLDEGCVVASSNEITLSGKLNVSAGNMEIPVDLEQTQSFSAKLVSEKGKQ